MSLDDFNSRYLISRALGEGTYGKVKLGRDLLTQTDVRGAYPPSVSDIFVSHIEMLALKKKATRTTN
jgi:serine/threonine protein kinase